MEPTVDIIEKLSATPGPRLITTTKYKGHTFQVHMHDADAFAFRVFEGELEVGDLASAPMLTRSGAGFPSTNRAEMAAEQWISEMNDGRNDAREVGGWRITILPDTKGTWRAEVRRVSDAEEAPEEFKGYQNRTQLQDEAMTWAAQHPCFNTDPAGVVADDEPDEDESERVEPMQEHDEAPVDVPAKEPTPEPAVARASTPAAAQPARSTIAQASVPRVDLEEHARLADEYTQLCAECVDLDNQIKELKSDLKSRQLRLGNLAGKMAKGMQALRDGRSAGPFQTRLPMPETAQSPPFGSTPEAGDAAQLAADRLKSTTETWPFNGVEHVIEVHEGEPGRWRAALRGHEADTEGFGESRGQAIGACQDRASIVFADCEPGSTSTSTDNGPLADGPAPKAKRPRTPKLKGKGRDEVVAALRSAMTLAEAAKLIGCTEAELEDYARRVDLKLSENLGRDTGEDDLARDKRTKRTPTNKPAPTSTKKANLAKLMGGKRGRQ